MRPTGYQQSSHIGSPAGGLFITSRNNQYQEIPTALYGPYETNYPGPMTTWYNNVWANTGFVNAFDEWIRLSIRR